MGESGDDAVVFLEVRIGFFHALDECVLIEGQDGRPCARIKGQPMLIVEEEKLPVVIVEGDFLVFENNTVLITENGKEDFVLQFRLHRCPVNIEKRGVTG